MDESIPKPKDCIKYISQLKKLKVYCVFTHLCALLHPLTSSGSYIAFHSPTRVSKYLHFSASASGTEVVDASHLRREPDTARAVDAAGHDSLDQRSHIFVFHRPAIHIKMVSSILTLKILNKKIIDILLLSTANENQIKRHQVYTI